MHAIYLLPSAQGMGLGRLLVVRFVEELRARRFGSMAVWVLARNPSRRFYETLGGVVIGEQEKERDGETFLEIAYGWSDLASFR